MPATGFRAAKLVELLVNQRRSPAAIRRLQERRLVALVRHAYEHVPFYRRLYDAAGVTPRDVRGLDDLERLPPVSKADLLDRPLDELLAEGVSAADCVASTSSGTTGRPLTVYSLPADRTPMNLGWTRAYLANGMRPTDTLAAFIGQRPAARRRRWNERAGLFRRVEISAWLAADEWIAALERWRPQAITGYVMTLRILTERLRERGPLRFRPRVLFQTSALLDDRSRKLFAEVLGCRVVDLYGSDEAGCVAWECPVCREYHVNSDLVLVEVLNDGRPAPAGGGGEVVVTNLHSRAMPIIRYRQGDAVRVSAAAPRCGRPFPLISGIDGRVEDFLVLRDGTRMPPHPFYHCIDPVPGVRRWRIEQDLPGALRLEIEPSGELSEERLRRITADLRALTRGEMEIELVTVGEIPVPPGAKFRTIRSRAGAGPR